MNVIKINVNFKNRTIYKQGVDLTSGDYNSTKLKFQFDREDGRKVFKMKDPDGKLVLLTDITNDEVELVGKDENGNNASLFKQEGKYIFEISLYDGDSKLTSAFDYIKVKKEEVVVDGEVITPYLPIFDELVNDIAGLEKILKDKATIEDMKTYIEGHKDELKGDDYVLTEDDKKEIASLIEIDAPDVDIPTKVSQLENDSKFTTEEYVENAINKALKIEEKPEDGSILPSKISVSQDNYFVYNNKNLYQVYWDSTGDKYVFFEIDDNNITFTCEMNNGTATVLWLIIGKKANGDTIMVRLNQFTGTNSDQWGVFTVNSTTRVTTDTFTAESKEDVFVKGDVANVYYDEEGVHILKNGEEVLYIAFEDYAIVQPLLGFTAYYAMGSATERLMVSNLGYKSNVDLKTVDLFIFAGQSNMAGRGQGADAPVVPIEAGAEFRAISDPTQLYEIDESVIPFGLNENLDEGISDIGSDGALKKSGSLVPAFINAYYERTGVRVVGVSASEGSTTTRMWVEDSQGGLYADLINRWNLAETWLTENGYKIGRRLMFWLQGEGDAVNSVPPDTYIERMNTLINTQVIPNTTIEKCLIIRIGHRNTDDYDYDYIMETQNEICRRVDNAIMASVKLGEFVDLSYYNKGDTTHFNQTALNLLGEDVGKNTAEYVNTGLYPILNDNLTNSILYGKSYNDRKTKEYIDNIVGDIETLLGGI